MSKKQQPLSFSKPNYSNSVHINPLRIIQKVGKKPQEDNTTHQRPHPTAAQSTDFRQSQIPKTKQIAKPKEERPGSYRTKMCPYGRECRKRARCNFAHTREELRRPFFKRTKPCLLYQRGLCSLGSACREYHGNIELKNFDDKKYKTELCEEYEKGSCPKQKFCTKAHGREELEYYLQESTRMQLETAKTNNKPEQTEPEKQEEKLVYRIVPHNPQKRSYGLEIVPKGGDPEDPQGQQEVLSEENPQISKKPEHLQTPEVQPQEDFSFTITVAPNSNN